MSIGKELLMATLFGSGGTGGGGSSGGGIPQADIDAAFAALAEKGVTVPDGATSADLDDLIASIVTGGGGIDGFNTLQGTFTLSEDVTSGYHELTCGHVDEEPQQRYSIVYIAGNFPDGKESKHLIGAFGSRHLQLSSMGSTGVYLVSSGSTSKATSSVTGNSYLVHYENTNGIRILSIRLYTTNSPLLAGVTYGWLYFYK